MKLVFQIAGGIILAGLILFVGNATVAFFAAKALTETIQETQIEQARIYKQRQMQLDAQAKHNLKVVLQKKRAQEQKNQAFIEARRLRNLELDRQLQKEREKKRKVRVAWGKYYEKPYQCGYPDSEQLKAWCSKHVLESKKEFNQLIKDGNIRLSLD